MKKVIFITTLAVLVSCKSNEKETKSSEKVVSKQEQTVPKDENLKAIEQGLDNFWEVEAPNGAKIIVNMDKIFVIQENPTEVDTEERYLLHVKLISGEMINLDFNYKDHVLDSKTNSKYKNAAIAYRELPLEPIFSILIGQFNEKGRIWTQVLHKQNFY